MRSDLGKTRRAISTEDKIEWARLYDIDGLSYTQIGKRANRASCTVMNAIRNIHGLCGDCAEPLDKKGVYCKKCTAINKKQYQQRRSHRKKHGLCMRCGDHPQLKNHRVCSRCLSTNRRLQKTKETRLQENNLCYRCNKPNDRWPLKFCADCSDHQADVYKINRIKQIHLGLCMTRTCSSVPIPGSVRCLEHWAQQIATGRGSRGRKYNIPYSSIFELTKHLLLLYKTSDATCPYCGIKFDDTKGHQLQADKIVPSIGYIPSTNNIELICGGCNSRKSDYDLSSPFWKQIETRQQRVRGNLI